jgi:hypothetical protein
MEFQQKYLKYKEKYLELKKMKAGQYRYMPRGPMIGYPAVPYMSPQVRVTGPIPGPMPLPIGLPGPMLVGPRFVRVTEEHKCPSCAGPASYKLYAVFSDKTELSKYNISSEIKLLILDTPDEKYHNLVETELKSIKSLRPLVSKTSPTPMPTPSIYNTNLEFDFSGVKYLKKIAHTYQNSIDVSTVTDTLSVTFSKN